MRRTGDLWSSVTSFRTLVQAAHTAARGKRRAANVARLLERVEPEALALQRELLSGAWTPSRVYRFEIHDPKLRTITVTPFRDQVVHHALMSVLAPILERRMLADSFACRLGKGQHAALQRAQQYLRRHTHFLKLDIASFFASVRHDVALDSLARCIKDRQALLLVAKILRGPLNEPPTEQGLALGSLTSQWLANLVLDRLDHFVKEELRIPGYVRYMDDCVLFADGPEPLRDAHLRIASFVEEPLALKLKERATILAPHWHGLPFLGWLLYRGTRRLRPENRRRYRWRFALRRHEFASGRRTQESYRQCVASLFALLEQGDTLALRRTWLARHSLDL